MPSGTDVRPTSILAAPIALLWLTAAGFAEVTVEPTRIYRVDDAREFLTSAGIDVDALGPE